jgi:hypothetical protein
MQKLGVFTNMGRRAVILLLSVVAILIDGSYGVAGIEPNIIQNISDQSGAKLADAIDVSPPACGPASLAIALKLLNCNFTNEELTGIADEHGDSTFAQLAEIAKKKGLYVVAVHMGPGQLLKLHRIAILQILSPAVVNGVHPPHFIVFAGPVPNTDHGPWWKKDEVFLLDPIAGDGLRGPLPIDALSEMYMGNALVISKSPINLGELGVTGVGRSNNGWRAVRNGMMAGFLAATMLWLCAGFRRKRPSTTITTVASAIVLITYISLFVCGISFADADLGNTATRPANDSQATTLTNGNQIYRAGVVSKGERVKHSFEVQNSGTVDFDLQIESTSCTCLNARFDGPTHLRPGEKTNIILDASARNGGPSQTSALIKTSTQEMFILTIQMQVTNNTVYTPRTIDFGDVWADEGKQSRPLHFTHYTTNGNAFKDFHVRSLNPSLSISTGNPTWSSGNDGAITFDEDLTVTLDPAMDPTGPLGEGIVATASDGNKKLSFSITCIGQVVPIVAAVPDQIAVFGGNLPNEITESVMLKSVDARAIRVETVGSSDVSISKWTAIPSLDGMINLELTIKHAALQGRSQGTLHVKFASPQNYSLDIPVRIVDSAVQ